jgi:hypothetical protein
LRFLQGERRVFLRGEVGTRFSSDPLGGYPTEAA